MEPKHKAEREVEAVVKWCEKQYHVMRKRKPRVPVETTLQIPTRAFYILENGSGKIEKSEISRVIEEVKMKYIPPDTLLLAPIFRYAIPYGGGEIRPLDLSLKLEKEISTHREYSKLAKQGIETEILAPELLVKGIVIKVRPKSEKKADELYEKAFEVLGYVMRRALELTRYREC